MSEIVFGVFEDQQAADQAITAVEQEFGSRELSAFVHTDGLRDEDIQMRGTSALRGAINGALLVGIAGAVIGGLILIPNAELSVGWTEWVFMSIGGTIFGVTAGAVAGASESRDEIRTMANAMDEGQVLVTMEVSSEFSGTQAILDFMTRHGALEVQTA